MAACTCPPISGSKRSSRIYVSHGQESRIRLYELPAQTAVGLENEVRAGLALNPELKAVTGLFARSFPSQSSDPSKLTIFDKLHVSPNPFERAYHSIRKYLVIVESQAAFRHRRQGPHRRTEVKSVEQPVPQCVSSPCAVPRDRNSITFTDSASPNQAPQTYLIESAGQKVLHVDSYSTSGRNVVVLMQKSVLMVCLPFRRQPVTMEISASPGEIEIPIGPGAPMRPLQSAPTNDITIEKDVWVNCPR